jgi:hypothetical protein
MNVLGARELSVSSTKNLRLCPSCHNGQFETLSGSDSRARPVPGPHVAARRHSGL